MLSQSLRKSCSELKYSRHVIVHRITGDGPPDLMIGPMWSLNKWEVLNSIDAEFVRRGSWQGKYANEEKQK